jgi:hypothetical protein
LRFVEEILFTFVAGILPEQTLFKVFADYPLLFEDDTTKAELNYLECDVLLRVPPGSTEPPLRPIPRDLS